LFDGIAQENKNALTLIMDVNKQYKFEVYNRNSFSDEQKKEKRALIIFVIVIILVVAFLFIRSAYLNKIQFEEKVEGILQDKSIGKRGKFTIKVYNSKNASLSKYIYSSIYEYDHIGIYDKLKISDSVFKHFNSHIFYIYRKRKDAYVLIDSFNIKFW
jgi:hypothetical protein